MLQYKSIGELVRQMEQDDKFGNTSISKYVTFGLRENVEKIDAYLNSKHISGERDSKGREKPFFNIVTSAVNIWYRATDIDRKHIKIRATKAKHKVLAFLATILLQEWMNKSAFGVYLNKWGLTLARYGSAVTKIIEKDGELFCEIIPWNRMICDPIDFENNPKIEKIWLTPAQLSMRKGYNKEMVRKLMDAHASRTTMDGQTKDNKSEYILLYEVHGNLSEYYLTNDMKDEDNFIQQMNVMSYMARKDSPKEFDEYTLYSGKEEKDPYSIDHLIEEEGRVMSQGAVECLFESQWMMNHTVKAIKDQLDLASKLFFQTADGNFLGRNAGSAIDNGDILIHELNKPITEVNNSSHDIISLQNFGNQWQINADRITNTPEAQRGGDPKAGTAWRLQETVIQQSESLFELMTENKGLALENKLRKYIIPHFKKQLDTSEEISAILDDLQIKEIDSLYLPAEATRRANEIVKNDILNKTPEDIIKGNLMTPEDQSAIMGNSANQVQQELNGMGSQRFIKPSEISSKTWKEALKDLEWVTEIDITDESVNNKDTLTTLNSVLQTIANPATAQALQTPEGKLVFNKILENAGGISPLELQSLPKQPVAVGAPQGGLPAMA